MAPVAAGVLHRLRPVPGIGLGLPVPKRIIEAMGGEVGVDGAPGKGSRFWFTVPPA